MNNRNCKPSLRLVDGGPSPWSLKGMFKAATAPSAPAETVSQKYARQDAERAAKAAAAAPAAPAPVQPAAGISGYVGNAALQAREKAAGLRDGGEVPGSGRGDKVPALYEPGEFVVSNAMLKRAPGLRDQLHDLRAEALAGQGKTVAQADAEAYDDGYTGESHERVSEGSEGRVGEHEGRHMGAQGDDPRRRPGLRSLDQVTLRANQGFGFSEDFLKKASDAIGERFNPTQPPDGRYGAPPNPPPNSAVQPAAPAAQPGPRPSLRAGVGSQSGAAQKALYASGRTAAGLTKLAGALGPAAVGADVVSHFNDYKINDPEVDSSNAGTFGALAKGDFSGAGRSFSKGALEAGMDLGSFAANTLDYVVRGKAPMSTAYDGMLRRQFGDQLQAHPSVSAQADAARATTAQPSAPSLRTPAQTQPFTGAQGPMGPQINPDAPSLRGRPGADVAGAPGVSKFVENGRTLYSNVAGDNAYMMDKNMVNIMPSVGQARIDRDLTNPDGSRWTALDGAIMDANLRDGIDPYRGTSRQKGEDEAAQLKGMRELAFSKQGTPGRLGAMKMFAEQQQQQTLRQGQDLKYKGDVYNADMTAALAQLKARADATKDQRDFAAGRYDKGLEQGAKMDEQGRAAFKNKFDTLDKDGKPIARPDMEAAAYELIMRQNPNWSQLPQRERAQLQSDAFDYISLVGNLRDHQNNSIWQSIGLKDADVRADRMPNLAGAKLETTGFIEGKVTPNASSGDYKLTTKDGKTMYLGRDKVTEDQLSYLKRMGVTLGSK